MKTFLISLGLMMFFASHGQAQTNEVLVSSGDFSNVASSTITFPTASSTTYRVVYGLLKDATAGTIGVYTNNDTSGSWSYGKYGVRQPSGNSVAATTTGLSGCLLSQSTINQDANSALQGQFYITTLWENPKAAVIYGISTATAGNSGANGAESGGCLSPTESSAISKFSITSNAGKFQTLHWELWQGVTHSP